MYTFEDKLREYADLLVRVGGSSGCKLTERAIALTKEYRRVQAAAQAAAD